MLFTVRPCPLCLPQPLLWPRRPGSGHGSHVGGGGSGQGSSRRSGGGGTGVNTACASGGASAGSNAPASAGGGSSAATAGGGGGTATAGVGGAALLLDKEAFLCIRLRMTPQYSIDRSQRGQLSHHACFTCEVNGRSLTCVLYTCCMRIFL